MYGTQENEIETKFHKVEMQSKYKPIRSLLKGLTVLEAFTSSKYSLSFQELALKTGMPKASTFRFLQTLLSQNYISFDSASKKYFIGPRVLSLGFTVLSGLELKDVAHPYLQQLSRISNQNVNLAILDGTEAVFIERINRGGLLSINLSVGSRVNLYQTASGRAILAFLGREKFEYVVGQLSRDRGAVKHIGSNGRKLKQVIEAVRRRGYAVNDEELIDGVRAIAAPIFNRQGEVEGAITMPVFSHSVSQKELIRTYVPPLMDAVKEISDARGFMGSYERFCRTGASRRKKKRHA